MNAALQGQARWRVEQNERRGLGAQHVRCAESVCAGAALYIAELRSGVAGHWSYRVVRAAGAELFWANVVYAYSQLCR